MTPRRLLPALVVLAACGGPPRIVRPGHDGDYAPRIADQATWDALAARSETATMAGAESVKFLIDRDDGDAVYFTQSRRWPMHYAFARRFLDRVGLPVPLGATFNQVEYHDADRRFILGTLSHYAGPDVWAFELFANDTLDLATTARAFETIKARVFVGDRLRYHPVPEAHVAALADARARMPVVTTDELFGAVTYQPLELGEAWGRLRIVPPGPVDLTTLHPYDVVVFAELPLDVPPVAGIVTAQLQAPLGHVAVLAHTRHTPNMALRGAATAPELVALDGQLVHLTITGSAYRVTTATQPELDRALARRRPKPLGHLRRSDDDVGLPALAQIAGDDLRHFGAKTAQLAKVARLEGIYTPRAFGLPFHAYAAFLADTHLDRQIAALLADPALATDDAARHAALDRLQAAIRAAPVSPALVQQLRARIAEVLPGSRQIRLRSSTNSEDLAGFSGAGLYRSARVPAGDDAALADGLREVWASVWSWQAFEERRWYGIAHADVAMGILVQESIDDDVGNGVAITGNPFFEGRPGVWINVAPRGSSVTGAGGDEVPEQILSYTYFQGRAIERVSTSKRATAQVMTDAEVRRFTDALERIHRAFTGEKVGSAAAVDVEFLIAGPARRLVIVQARPYRLDWSGDRSYDLSGT